MPPRFAVTRTAQKALVLKPGTRLDDAVEAMQRAGVNRATVFDGHRLHGTLSREDITRYRARQAPGAPPSTVADAMQRTLDFGLDLTRDPALVVERGGD